MDNPAGTQIDLTSTLSASNNTATLYQTLSPSARFETAGATSNVRITDAFPDAGQVVIADAIKFVYSP